MANEFFEGYLDTLILGAHIYFNVYELSSGTIVQTQKEYSELIPRIGQPEIVSEKSDDKVLDVSQS